MKNKIQRLIGILLLLPTLVWADPARLTNITVSNGDSSARIEFIATQPTTYRAFTLEKPYRLVIDFPKTRLAMNLSKIKISHSAVKSIRDGHPDASTLRLVLDLNYPVKFKAQAEAKKVMVDIYAVNVAQKKTTSSKTPSPVLVTQKQTPRQMVVVIDPGHGGKDPGASGENGTKEKTVVLAISRRLADLINRQPNMRAVLTRNGDYFVPLRERLKLARKGKADLFIAIHADSYFNTKSTGASVYALSRRGATSEAARWLAKRDNYSELGGVDLGDLEDKSYVLRSVLIDLAQTATVTDSLRLGNAMLDSLDAVTKLHYSRVEQAPFVVLKSPDIPSILVETGFISNPSEEVKLRDPYYQNRIAQALFNGVQLYIKKYSTAHV